MAQIVLVHGIAQEHASAESLERDWTPALSDGVRDGGFGPVGDRIWQRRADPGGITTRMAAYGDLFLDGGARGAGLDQLDAEQQELAGRIAAEWLGRAATRSPNPADRDVAAMELDQLRGRPGEERGLWSVARRAIAGAARIRWFAKAGMPVAQLVNESLVQVTRYLTEDGLRQKAIDRVLAHLGDDTRVLVGHSLGSVVAFEAAHQYDRPLPLLVTLGSPLGLRTVIYDRLRPAPPSYPRNVARWENIADPDDVVAAEPNLTGMFGTVPAGCRFSSHRTDNGAQPHSATFYLGKAVTGRPVGEAF